jgi:multidrug resistance efflux pump
MMRSVGHRSATALLASGILVAVASCNHGAPTSGSTDNGDNSERPGIPIRTATVRMGEFADVATAYGTVSGGANSQASLAFPEGGRIASVDGTIGERVRAGQVLARLDTRPFEADVAGAAAALRAADANERRTALGARPQQVAQTDAQIQQARTQLSVTQAQRQRQQELLGLGIASQSDVDAARSAVATARSQLSVLRDQRVTQTHPWQPDVDAARAGVAQAQAALRSAQQKLALAKIAAPFSGVVVARFHNDGESVEANAPVIQIANEGAPAVFSAQFSPAEAARVHIGESAIVRPQGISGVSIKGRVVAINPAQGDARTVPVLIRLTANLPSFGPGAYGQAAVTVGARRGLIVPKESVVSDAATGSVQVFRRDGERYIPVPVTVVATVGQRAIVWAPQLRGGMVVAAEGAAQLATPQQGPKADKN